MKKSRKASTAPEPRSTPAPPPELPREFQFIRSVIAVAAIIYFINGITVVPPQINSAYGWYLLQSAAPVLLWYSPWFWFLKGIIWWPMYILSATISFSLTRNVIGIWTMQYMGKGEPFATWSPSLQYLVLFGTLIGMIAVWQTVVLGIARVRGFRGKGWARLRRVPIQPKAR